MEHCGIDVHKKESQICLIVESGEYVEKRLPTTRQALGKWFAGRAAVRVLIESSTESEWVARCLEGHGHEVIVADPNYVMMYATRSRKVKTDKRDARALAEACRLGVWRPAHRVSDEQRHVRNLLQTRESLVSGRTRLISQAMALLRRDGFRLRSGNAETFAARVDELPLPGRTRSELGPLLAIIVHVTKEVAGIEQRLGFATANNADVARARSMYGVGLIVASAFVAALDGVERFASGSRVQSYLGLVPRESSSGEKQQRGHITKTGDRRMRRLLVQSAWCILRSKSSRVAHLRTWAERIAARRGKRIAAVALARRLTGILYALLRDETTYRAPPAGKEALAA